MEQINKNNYSLVINNNELYTLAKGYDEKYKIFRNNKNVKKYFDLEKKVNNICDEIDKNKARVNIKTAFIRAPFTNIYQLNNLTTNENIDNETRNICIRILNDLKGQKHFTNLALDAVYINQYITLLYGIYVRENKKTKKAQKEIELFKTGIDVLIEDKRLNVKYNELVKEYNKYVPLYNAEYNKINDLRNRIRAIGQKEVKDRFKVPAQKPINEVEEDYRNAFNNFDGCDVLKNGQVKIYIENKYNALVDKTMEYKALYTKDEINEILEKNKILFRIK